MTASATLFLPLMSHETLTFSPAFRPGSFEGLGERKRRSVVEHKAHGRRVECLDRSSGVLDGGERHRTGSKKAAAAVETMILRLAKYSWERAGILLAPASSWAVRMRRVAIRFVLMQFRTENRFAVFLERLGKPPALPTRPDK
ncbi:hypothetical protein [Mesorhizobium sp. B4-1-4]|uniref:hypothetical protein n=1 Tax=Mesorhizobium sp. B4-1-4 TaxID=2589888 RepID=UPI0015E2D828|nr:hypothetical protein [Mesorhizobium sp. B4-1-4]UCI29648.1 hypothetical protein FJW03_17570 [Mesorhizobium sp. B4-1-4]